MGTSGNRSGYKVFSINTTVRNPKRNTDFIKCFIPYEGKEFNNELSFLYYFDLVINGIYQFSDIPENVKRKLSEGISLTKEEAIEIIKNNPQATGVHGRVMTQLRALKDQGFLMFTPCSKGVYKIYITQLGNELIKGIIDPTIIYTKAMLGLHANSPIRTKIYNKSRPFLNTIFVINELKKQWKTLGYEPKGILRHEFSTFVLSMKDCNYKKAVEEIIKYRLKFKYEINMPYINEYLQNNDILPIDEDSIKNDYQDDVFRKFEMTGLIIKRGMFNYTYYDFSVYNAQKIESLLNLYKNYEFKQFNSQEEYYNFLSNIDIPWQNNEKIRQMIIKSKQKILNVELNEGLTLIEKEKMLDRMFYNMTLEKTIDKFDYKFIFKELLILAGEFREKSKLSEISEPLRLEYLIALLMGKKYGTEGLISNIIYGEDGSPLHFAPSGKCDIVYIHKDGAFILEPTMQRGKNQILNNETTNVARHVKEETQNTNLEFKAMMIAPYVHPDVVHFFQFAIYKDKVRIAPLNIKAFANLINESDNINSLSNDFSEIVKNLVDLDYNSFADKINNINIDNILKLYKA